MVYCRLRHIIRLLLIRWEDDQVGQLATGGLIKLAQHINLTIAAVDIGPVLVIIYAAHYLNPGG